MQKRRAKSPGAPKKVPLNVELDSELVRELRLRSVHRRLDGVEPWEIRGIVAEALAKWLKENPKNPK